MIYNATFSAIVICATQSKTPIHTLKPTHSTHSTLTSTLSETHPSIAPSIRKAKGREVSVSMLTVLTNAQLFSAANVFRSSVMGDPMAHNPECPRKRKKEREREEKERDLTTETKFKTHSAQLNSTQLNSINQPTNQPTRQNISPSNVQQAHKQTQHNTTTATTTTTVYLDPEEGISYQKCVDTFPVHGVERPQRSMGGCSARPIAVAWRKCHSRPAPLYPSCAGGRKEGRTDEWMKEGKVFVINVKTFASSPSFRAN
jgi:hypothetical protein